MKKNNVSRKATYSQSELYQIFLDVHIDGDNMKAYTVEQLKEISASLKINVTGNKSQLIQNIIESLYLEFMTAFLKSGNTTYCGKSGIEYMFKTGLDETFTRQIIRKIERGTPIITDNGIEYLKDDSYDACHKIINTGFTDEIYNDVFQTVRTYLWESMNNDLCYINNDRIRFSDYDFSANYNGFKCAFQSVYKALSPYRATYKKSMKDGEHLAFCSEYGDNESIKNVSDMIESGKYEMMLSTLVTLEDIEHTDYIRAFYRYCQKHYPKDADILLSIIVGSLSGYTDKDIAKHCHVSAKTIQRKRPFLRVVYNEYQSKTGNKATFQKNSTSETYGGYMKDNNSTSGYCYGMIFDSEIDKLTMKHDFSDVAFLPYDFKYGHVKDWFYTLYKYDAKRDKISDILEKSNAFKSAISLCENSGETFTFSDIETYRKKLSVLDVD